MTGLDRKVNNSGRVKGKEDRKRKKETVVTLELVS